MHSDQAAPKLTELDHISGMPASLMCEVEQRLIERIHEAIVKDGTVAEENRFIGYKWRALWAMRADEYAKDILYRMLNKRINDGRQFDSILDASRKAVALSMFIREITPK